MDTKKMQNLKFKNQKLHFIGNWKLEIGNSKRGNALISVIFISAISIVLSSAAIIVLALSILSASNQQNGDMAISIAESGAEDALLRLLRESTYTSSNPHQLTVGDGTASITATGSYPNFTITSVGTVNGFSRTVVVTTTGDATTHIMNISSWKE